MQKKMRSNSRILIDFPTFSPFRTCENEVDLEHKLELSLPNLILTGNPRTTAKSVTQMLTSVAPDKNIDSLKKIGMISSYILYNLSRYWLLVISTIFIIFNFIGGVGGYKAGENGWLVSVGLGMLFATANILFYEKWRKSKIASITTLIILFLLIITMPTVAYSYLAAFIVLYFLFTIATNRTVYMNQKDFLAKNFYITEKVSKLNIVIRSIIVIFTIFISMQLIERGLLVIKYYKYYDKHQIEKKVPKIKTQDTKGK